MLKAQCFKNCPLMSQTPISKLQALKFTSLYVILFWYIKIFQWQFNDFLIDEMRRLMSTSKFDSYITVHVIVIMADDSHIKEKSKNFNIYVRNYGTQTLCSLFSHIVKENVFFFFYLERWINRLTLQLIWI